MSKLRQAFDLTQKGKVEEAWELIREASKDPATDPVVYYNVLGEWHFKQQNWEAALPQFMSCLDAAPYSYVAAYNVGFCLFKMARRQEAAEYFQRCLKFRPDHTAAWVRLGAIFLQEQHFALSLACYEYARRTNPKDPEALGGYGTILGMFDMDAEAVTEFRKAVEIDPKAPEWKMGLGFYLLKSGRWKEGWAYRNAVLGWPPFGAPWDWKAPEFWRGPKEGLAGKRVMVWSEQGHGDTIQFCRYLYSVQRHAAEVIVGTEPALVRLVESLGLGVRIFKRGDPEPEHDLRVTMMSVPETFGTTPETCPPPAAFEVEARESGAQIGVCWHGGGRPYDPSASADDKRRSIPLELFQPIIDASGGAISLQEEDLREWGVTDWYDTARLVKPLKLVITVDTAVAHLAASFGIETWLLARAGGCWRWGARGDRTPWYPSMRIYRQPALGEWKPVIDRVVRDLGEWRTRNDQ